MTERVSGETVYPEGYKYGKAVEYRVDVALQLRGDTTVEIQQRLRHRSLHAISGKRAQMTRHWPTPEECAAREAFERKRDAKQLKVDWRRTPR